MIRRLARIVIAAFCLLSLLGALGVAWLWWECRQGRGYVADGSIGGMYLMAESRPGGRSGLSLVRGWPGRPALRLWTQRGYYEDHAIYWSRLSTRYTSRPLGLTVNDGELGVQVRQDTGEAVRWDAGKCRPRRSCGRRPRCPFGRSGTSRTRR
jgi:hypothetical protein